jgi:hypothetical protein
MSEHIEQALRENIESCRRGEVEAACHLERVTLYRKTTPPVLAVIYIMACFACWQGKEYFLLVVNASAAIAVPTVFWKSGCHMLASAETGIKMWQVARLQLESELARWFGYD